MSAYAAGLDLGQAADATALVVVHRSSDTAETAATARLEVVGLWRWHGVSYVETVARVRELLY